MRTLAVLLALIHLSWSAYGFVNPRPGSVVQPGARPRGSVMIMRAEDTPEQRQPVSRRSLLEGAAGLALVIGVIPGSAWAGLPPRGPSVQEMLKKTQGTRSAEEEAERKARLVQERKERMERMKELEAEEAARKLNKSGPEVEIDADLRANYYYPTARKRYLPRIKAAADALEEARTQIQSDKWSDAEEFAQRTADAAALPLKLYASSLTGQGLSLEVSYVKVLVQQGDVYGKELEALKKAVGKKDKKQALVALDGLEAALTTYRKTARIDTPDGGVGEFPTDGKLGAAFLNNSPTLYLKGKSKGLE